jgi:parallel beta-helix repeat protein
VNRNRNGSHVAPHRLVAFLRATIVVLALAVTTGGNVTAATFYVDQQSATCNNAGAGTEAEPYCTISAALAAHSGPDVTIMVKPGVYREQVTIPASGAAGLPCVIQASGPGVVVDGSDDFANVALWTLSTGTVYRAASVTWNVLQVYVDGARLRPAAVTPDLLLANEFTFVSGQGLYVNLGGANPGSRQTLVGRRNFGFNMFTKSFVTIDGFEVAHIESRGINIQTGCADLVISRNRVSFANSYGIQTVNGQRIVIDGNVVSDCNLHGIGLTAGASGCTVRNNDSFRNIDPTVRRANGIHLFGAPGNTLHGNRVHDNQDSGIQFAGGSNNCIAFNNRSWNNGDHGFDHLASMGVFHTNEVASGNVMDGFSFEGASPGGRLYNSIAVNNGLTSNEFDLWVDLASSVGFLSDRNIFWNATLQNPIKIDATSYALLLQYQLASGQDANSFQADPRFANAAVGDFNLLGGSPGIDAGDSGVPNWPAADAAGAPRFDHVGTVNTGAGPVTFSDIGALEFVLLFDSAPVVSCPSINKPGPGGTVTFTVSALDPDGEAILSLVMVEKKMPPNSGATFVANATNTGGTFTWATGTAVGNFQVEFVATNALIGKANANIQIKTKGRHAAEEATDESSMTELALSGAFPNPSAGAVEFAIDLPRDSQVRWAVFDLQGRMVWSEERAFAAGRQSLRWNGMASGRGKAPTGVYLLRASVDGAQFTRRMVRF